MPDLHFVMSQIMASAERIGFALALLTIVEILLPKGNGSLPGRIKGLLFWLLWIPVTATVLASFESLWAYLRIPPLIQIPLDMPWLGVVSGIAAALAGAFISDFFFYWFHRGQHAFFWRFHAVHHSIRDMNAVNSFHHISESAINILLFVIPTSLIVANPGPVPTVISAALLVYPFLLHSPTQFNFGPFRAVFADNRFHRIHHSMERHHYDTNFGAFTTIWDQLFGTAYFPGRDEWPDTGLEDVDQPRNVKDWLLLPARVGR